ncbi:glycosyl transferase [Leptospira kobayashii]|uniref:Glycosyl transferase n=1 Tax=Leptospira kobayashii TaxID=1917830 RepID=A0ABM7UJY5_9LEPT|nr:glycosyltransferase family 2 protein [Leptospira kobayashii]BDA79155.1 glycosyl transferase [Leptospira kobayashii]
MKISIITAVYNRKDTIRQCIESVLAQKNITIEYIIVDGGSKDGTKEIIESYGNKIQKFISEPDKGIYDALNKGFRAATGDVIGLLHSDDRFADDLVLARIAETFSKEDIDAVFADIIFVNSTGKLIRRYKSGNFKPNDFAYGKMPAHPSFYAKKEIYDRLGLFDVNFKIAADFELLARFFKANIRYKYIPETWVVMQTGGESTKSIKSNLLINREIKEACDELGIKTNYFKIYSKYFTKLFEFIV